MSTHRGSGFKKERLFHIFKFLLNYSETAVQPVQVIPLATLYGLNYGLSRSKASRMFQKLRTRLTSIISFEKMGLSLNTKVKMFFVLGARVCQKTKVEIKEVAEFQLDDHQRLIEYQSKDGSLKLKGSQKLHHRLTPTLENTVFGDFGSTGAEEGDDEESGGEGEEEDAMDESIQIGDVTGSSQISTAPTTSRKRNADNVDPTPRRSKRSADPSSPMVASQREEEEDNIQPPAELKADIVPKPEPVERAITHSFVPVKEENSVATVDLFQVLSFLEETIDALEESSLDNIQARVIAKKEVVRNMKMPVTSLADALDSVLKLVTRPLSSTTDTDSSTSLRDFVMILQTLLARFKFDELKDFKNQLKNSKNLCSVQDVPIPLVRVQSGLQYFLEFIL